MGRILESSWLEALQWCSCWSLESRDDRAAKTFRSAWYPISRQYLAASGPTYHFATCQQHDGMHDCKAPIDAMAVYQLIGVRWNSVFNLYAVHTACAISACASHNGMATWGGNVGRQTGKEGFTRDGAATCVAPCGDVCCDRQKAGPRRSETHLHERVAVTLGHKPGQRATSSNLGEPGRGTILRSAKRHGASTIAVPPTRQRSDITPSTPHIAGSAWRDRTATRSTTDCDQFVTLYGPL
jgi:hypothetical protein